MIETLKFVQGAVAKKDFIPALTHFCIKDGFIRGFNGRLSLCSPIDLDIEAYPKALPFVKAIEKCSGTVALTKTASGRLSVKSGNFKAFIDCIDGDFPDVQPEGTTIPVTEDFLPVLKRVAPFIAEDASRPWATGVLFHGGSAFATNNIVIIEHWLGYEFPHSINIPTKTIKELLRIGSKPDSIQISDNSITFHYPDNRWVRSNLLSLDWPDISKVLDRPSNALPVEDTFYEVVERLSSFTDESDRILFMENALSTHQDDNIGAKEDLVGIQEGPAFQAKQLLSLRGVANKIDFAQYPAPCIFFGENLRGAIIGVRV